MGVMIERKKRLMMLQKQDTYIMNGLVLWLDGIDKGNVTGSWVDKISGYEFVAYNGVTFGNDYLNFNASSSQYLKNETFTSPLRDNGTIEIVATDFQINKNGVLFVPNIDNGLAFGTYNADGGSIIWAIRAAKPIVKTPNSFKTISINNSIAVADMNQLEFGDDNYWSGLPNANYIGCRASGTYFHGKIHAIRIYNRQLTLNEMLHNQQIDNSRFNLGLTI